MAIAMVKLTKIGERSEPGTRIEGQTLWRLKRWLACISDCV